MHDCCCSHGYYVSVYSALSRTSGIRVQRQRSLVVRRIYVAATIVVSAGVDTTVSEFPCVESEEGFSGV